MWFVPYDSVVYQNGTQERRTIVGFVFSQILCVPIVGSTSLSSMICTLSVSAQYVCRSITSTVMLMSVHIFLFLTSRRSFVRPVSSFRVHLMQVNTVVNLTVILNKHSRC